MITFGAIVLLLACSHEPPAAAPAAAATAAHTPAAAKDDHGHAAHGGDGHHEAAGDGHGSAKSKPGGKAQGSSGFAVPFVWETSKSDPLAVARGHLKEMLNDNALYVSSKGKIDPAKISGQARTTIVTCSDAAVQLDALDTTPENDTFVTRNWGNLIEPSLGTITYGIEELHTPVLLIVGHTGCEAVKAVMQGVKFSKPVRSQISKLKLKAATGAKNETDSLNEAVAANVNTQVAKAVERFQPLVRTGLLTVIGAIYDPTNAFKRGQGRLSIVNVNTITDSVSMDAFVTAVTNDDKIVQALSIEHEEEHDEDAHEEHDQAAAQHGSAQHGSAIERENAAGARHPSDAHERASATPVAPHKAAKPATVEAHTTGPKPALQHATAKPEQHGSADKAHRLPQIDHLEPSLIGDGHHERAAANHEDSPGAANHEESAHEKRHH